MLAVALLLSLPAQHRAPSRAIPSHHHAQTLVPLQPTNERTLRSQRVDVSSFILIDMLSLVAVRLDGRQMADAGRRAGDQPGPAQRLAQPLMSKSNRQHPGDEGWEH